MKKLFVIALAVCLIGTACKEENVTSGPSERDTYIGKIVSISNPCQTKPCLPGIVLGLETTSNNYVLTTNSKWIWSNSLIVEDIEYFDDDEVEITGKTTIKQDINSNKYTELEIETIRKTPY